MQYTADQKEWAINISMMASQLRETERKSSALKSSVKKAKGESKDTFVSELSTAIATINSLKESIQSESWKFFRAVFGGWKGAPVALMTNDEIGDVAIADVIKISVINKSDIVISVIGLGMDENAHDYLEGIPPVNLIQAFESKNQYLSVLG